MEADEVRRRMPAIVAGEVAAINRTFQGRTLDAGTRPAWTVVAGRSYIAYGLRLGGAVLPQDVEKLLPKLTEALSALRRRPTDVRLRRKPLALEVAHPFPAPLDWQRARTALAADTMLTGRNYSGGEPCDDVLSFDDTPHVLAVGMSGSGKTTLLRMMVTSLALNTPPDALRMYIVDPKEEDFLSFERLPHCEMFAGRRDVTRAIAQVRAILADRQDARGRFDGERVVLFLDELSQVQEPNAIKQLNDLMAVGRSKRINVILATQYPTRDVIGKVDLSNVGVRFVGQVATNKNAYIAAGQGETFAHMLPGKGAFLRVGADVTRLQAYWLDDDGTEMMVDAAVRRWGRQAVSAGYRGGEQAVRTGATTGERAVRDTAHTGEAPVTPGPSPREWQVWGENTPAIPSPVSTQHLPVAVATRPAAELVPAMTYPLGKTRELTPAEATMVRRMKAQGLSGNAICEQIFGPKNTQRLDIIRRVVEGGAA